MIPSERLKCKNRLCGDVDHQCYLFPNPNVDLLTIHTIMISEAAPQNPQDYYYAFGNPLFQDTTVKAFNDAGISVKNVQDIIDLGVYLTTAIKCGKKENSFQADTIRRCSHLLEEELDLFPNKRVIMLMGDVAIKTYNAICIRNGNKKIIPSISTYKLHGQEFYHKNLRVYPSYLQAGLAFFIEKSKRKMIAEDIGNAFDYIRNIKSQDH